MVDKWPYQPQQDIRAFNSYLALWLLVDIIQPTVSDARMKRKTIYYDLMKDYGEEKKKNVYFGIIYPHVYTFSKDH